MDVARSKRKERSDEAKKGSFFLPAIRTVHTRTFIHIDNKCKGIDIRLVSRVVERGRARWVNNPSVFFHSMDGWDDELCNFSSFF